MYLHVPPPFFPAVHEPELLKLVVERAPAYAQKFGRLRLISVAQGKRLLKGLHFRIAYRIGKGKGRFRRFLPGGGRRNKRGAVREHPQGFGHEPVAFRQQKGALQHVFQLADIALPRLAVEYVHGRRADLRDVAAVTGIEAVDEKAYERGKIRPPFPEGRKIQGNDGKAVEKIFAEAPRLHILFQPAVRGRNEAHVDAHAFIAAHGPYLMFLNGAQKLGLGGGGKLAYFVQKHRAALRFLQKAAPAVHRAGERALHMAEKLAFQQRFGKSRTVDGEKELFPERACTVHIFRKAALARARFPGDENGHARVRHLAYDLQHLLHGGAVVDHGNLKLFLAGLLLKLAVQAGMLGRALHKGGKLRVVHGLGEVAVCPELHGLHRAFNGAHARHHDEGKLRVHGTHAPQHLQPAHAGHGKVAHHHVYAARGHAGQRPFAGKGRFRLPALARKKKGKNVVPFRVVVHHQDLIAAFFLFTHVVTLKQICVGNSNGKPGLRKEPAPLLRGEEHSFRLLCGDMHRHLMKPCAPSPGKSS